MTDTIKQVPKIGTRALAQLQAVYQTEQTAAIREIADLLGIDLKDGWQLNQDATAFVKTNGKPE